MIAIDTNLLIYAHRRGVPQHLVAREALERASAEPAGWGTAVSCVAEFWSLVTHPAAAGGPSRPALARAFLQELQRAAEFRIWRPGPDFGERLLEIACAIPVAGPRIFDLQIALTALDNGATTIWSHDRRFATVPELPLVDPLPDS